MVKISGLLTRTVASASAVMQQSGSIVIDSRHAKTQNLAAEPVHDRGGRYWTLPFRGHRRPLWHTEFPQAVHAPKHECHAGLKEVGCRRPAH